LRKRLAPVCGDVRRYKLYVFDVYAPPRMEELFSDVRPVWPFYGDVKLISDWEGDVERTERLAKRKKMMEEN